MPVSSVACAGLRMVANGISCNSFWKHNHSPTPAVTAIFNAFTNHHSIWDGKLLYNVTHNKCTAYMVDPKSKHFLAL